jgi:adenine phosphoribosyltransferase
MALSAQAIAELVQARVRDVADFPSDGVVFKDIAPLLADGEAFAAVVEHLAERYRGRVDAVVGIEARGFMLAAPVAYALGVGFVPVRKAGKLPGRTMDAEYDLEYGSAQIEVQVDAFAQGRQVLVLDDVLATGGTAEATCELVERAGAHVVEIAVLMELTFLHGRSKLDGHELYPLMVV